ncbi:MAG: glutamine--tRNA ligase/YqeY domain fusion protein [Kiritimatiellia bacterium]|nr:glutamine--tRNA ligase/YqeY domain fusion protein [Kiritimatiellia bacterium]
MKPVNEKSEPVAEHFIRQKIREDVEAGRVKQVVTRFPPEPNGFLHIGHAKAICLDFGMALEFGGRCHLRMDDTNPSKETLEYVDSIREDVRWLGFDWGEHFYYAADFFERMYECARTLIEQGRAYVCALSQEEWKEYRGVPSRPGRESPFRNRPTSESLDLFARMRAGEFADGALCVRAKIDMASPNLHLRDPVIYRILRESHYRAGDAWCIYPTYDFAHPLEDAFEGVTHSLCTLEFEVHRPLYDWVIESLGFEPQPRQTEFARLNMTYTVMSKRRLLQLVQENRVRGWDDPRMPTICGLRRRGVPPEAIRDFCEEIGITKYESLTDVALLDHCVRVRLNRTSSRRMAVLRPLKVVIENLPVDHRETFEAVNNPEDPSAGSRTVSFSREIYIDREDFQMNPPPKFYRLAPGREVRLRYAYALTCTGVETDPVTGEPVLLRAVVDPESRGGNPKDGRKIKATIHWVDGPTGCEAEFRMTDKLFRSEDPSDESGGRSWLDDLDPNSLEIVRGRVEPSLAAAAPGDRIQFERIGYFCADSRDHRPEAPVFNRTVSLKDSPTKPKA